MSKEWRPKNWENPFTVEHGNLSPDTRTETNIYEAGADAMLEALFKMASESHTGTFTIDSNVTTM